MLMYMAVDEGIEYELWILVVIAYLPLIGKSVTFLCKVQMNGVDTSAIVIQ